MISLNLLDKFQIKIKYNNIDMECFSGNSDDES